MVLSQCRYIAIQKYALLSFDPVARPAGDPAPRRAEHGAGGEAARVAPGCRCRSARLETRFAALGDNGAGLQVPRIGADGRGRGRLGVPARDVRARPADDLARVALHVVPVSTASGCDDLCGMAALADAAIDGRATAVEATAASRTRLDRPIMLVSPLPEWDDATVVRRWMTLPSSKTAVNHLLWSCAYSAGLKWRDGDPVHRQRPWWCSSRGNRHAEPDDDEQRDDADENADPGQPHVHLLTAKDRHPLAEQLRARHCAHRRGEARTALEGAKGAEQRPAAESPRGELVGRELVRETCGATEVAQGWEEEQATHCHGSDEEP